MARTRTPFRNLIFFLRVGAAIFGTAGLALYIPIFNNVLHYWASEQIGLTALPIASGAILLLWNTLSIIFMCLYHGQIQHLILTIGDFSIFVLATGMGVVGFVHDDVTYLNNGNHLDWEWTWSWDGDWLQIELIGAVMLLIAVIFQLLLVLFNYLEYRHLKRAARRASLPHYSVYQEQPVFEKQKGDDFELDWQSVLSEKAVSNEVKKPVSAVV